jgi:hypothetical protein
MVWPWCCDESAETPESADGRGPVRECGGVVGGNGRDVWNTWMGVALSGVLGVGGRKVYRLPVNGGPS